MNVKTLSAMALCAAALTTTAKTKLIIDSDVGSSTDDLFAFELAAKYHKDGLVDFAAVMIDRPGADNLAFTKAYLHYHGLDDVAIGTVDGTTEGQLIFVPYSKLVHSTLEVPPTRGGRVEEAVRLYRRILAGAEDASVDVCAIGFFVNLMKLLDSPGDEFSPLVGSQLVSRKVRCLRIMAGSFDGSLEHPEYNVWGDVKSAARIFSSWPTPIVATPYETGVKIYYPHREVLADFPSTHPLAKVYATWDPDGPRSKSQLMWDPMTVLGIVDEACKLGFFSDSARGTVTVDAKGFTSFAENERGNTVLQRITVEQSLAVRAYMRALGGLDAKPSTLETSPVRVVGVCAVPAADGDEFVTLANVSPLPVSLGGARIVCSQPEESVAVSFTVPVGTLLAAKGEITFRRRDCWPTSSIPDKAVNVLVYAPGGDVIAESFVDSRWFGGAANGTGGSFRAQSPDALLVDRSQWKVVGRTKKIVVLDCDPGTDDASAMFALSCEGLFPDVCIATYGNMPQPTVARNLLLLTAYLGESPAIYNGATTPSNGKLPSCGDFHGADGFGGNAAELMRRYPLDEARRAQVKPFEEIAARILAVDEVTYIAVGPLATLANLLAREPRVKDHIKHAYIMGGGLNSFNMPHKTEYNFFGDPVAVKQVLSSGLDITLFPLDLTHKDALLTAEQIDTLAATGLYPEVINFFRCNMASNVKTGQSKQAAVLHDVLPCLYSIHPELFGVRDVRLTVDEWGHIEENPTGLPVKIATDLAPGAFFGLFRSAF